MDSGKQQTTALLINHHFSLTNHVRLCAVTSFYGCLKGSQPGNLGNAKYLVFHCLAYSPLFMLAIVGIYISNNSKYVVENNQESIRTQLVYDQKNGLVSL